MEGQVDMDVSGLIRQLQTSVGAKERREAATQLGHTSGEPSLQALMAALDDPDPEVVCAAINSLQGRQEPGSVPCLMVPKVLRHEDPMVRQKAVAALGELGSFPLNRLVPLLADADLLVRCKAEVALNAEIDRVATRAGTDALWSLLRLMNIDVPEVRRHLLNRVTELAASQVPLLIECLESSSDLIRAGAARVLGRIKAVEAVPALCQLAWSDVDPARLHAVVALGQIGDPAAIEAVMSALDDHESQVRQAAVEALVAIGPECVPRLINKMEYFKSESTQRAAVTVLGRIGDKRAILPLVNRLGNTFFAVRAAVVIALSSMGEEVIPYLARVLTLCDLDLTQLIDLASRHPAVRLRLRAIRALGELKDSRAREALHELMEDPEPAIRRTAQEALSTIGLAKWARISALKVLGGIGTPACVEPLSMGLRDPHPDVRLQAVRSLSQIRDPRVAPLLATQLKGGSVRHRAAAVVGIGRCKEVEPEIGRQIVGLLKDPERSVRHQAARVLGWLACPEAIDGLVEAISDPAWRVVECAEISLSNYGEQAARKVVPLLETSRPESTRISAVRVLGQIDSSVSREALESAQNDAVPEISQAAHEALKNLDRM